MARRAEPTTPDLVVLALLAEKPRHGYEVNAELERRDVRDWAGISRPQVYYSLRKLGQAGLIAPDRAAPAGAGPERQVWRLLPAGRAALEDALERVDWATHRPPPPFLTWLALSPLARPGAATRVIAARRAFLLAELARERATLAELQALEADPAIRAARLMVDLACRQFETELAWLAEVEAAFAAPPAPPRPAAQPGGVRRVRPAI